MQAKYFLFLLFPISGFADVNMRDASYIHNVNEFTHPLFAKTYNSRSLHTGTFGFGWCSEFEKTLSPMDGTRYHCGQKLSVQAKPDKHTWILNRPDGTTEIYDADGKLISFKKATHPQALIFYDLKKRVESIHYQRKKFTFEYDEKSGYIKNISELSKSPTKYFFKNQNLVEIRKSKGQSIRFQYDEFHNLTLAQYPSRRPEKISYQDQEDEIQMILTENGCIENYHFQKISSTHLKSTIHRNCPSSAPQKKTFSFMAKRTPQGSLVLSQITFAGETDEKSRLP